MSIPAIGTQVELVFQTQFVTFTPEQFMRALKDRNYMEIRGQIADSHGQPISIQTFSKGDTTVFLPSASLPSPIVFRIINTVSLESRYKEVNDLLVAMNIYPNIISTASFTCMTKAKAKTHPVDKLTSIVDKTFVDRISKNLGTEMKVISVRLGTSFPMKQEGGYEVTIEPLMTNAEEEYFVSIVFRTHKMDEFSKFIDQFGSNMIQKIIEMETTENV
jgi:hypothetical protein